MTLKDLLINVVLYALAFFAGAAIVEALLL